MSVFILHTIDRIWRKLHSAKIEHHVVAFVLRVLYRSHECIHVSTEIGIECLELHMALVDCDCRDQPDGGKQLKEKHGENELASDRSGSVQSGFSSRSRYPR